ncbi:MAG TPA: HEAT repeat domain-containing protein, partial [Gemmatimonadales bacterium]|nr:HEAT repeat domain-containing protein [Gemmatimonadales bacterium]
MVNPVVFATHLARAVDLFRDPAKKEEQKREFRILVGLLKESGVAARVVDDVLQVNGEAVTAPEFQPLVQRMVLHGVTEIMIPADAPVAHLFELLRALADQPGASVNIVSRLRASGASRVSVVLAALDEPEEAPAEVPSRRGEPEEAGEPGGAEGPGGTADMGTRGVLRGEPVRDLRSTPIAGAEGVEQVEQNLAPPSVALPSPDAGTPHGDVVPRESGGQPELPATHVEGVAPPPQESIPPLPANLPPRPPPPPPPPPPLPQAPTFRPSAAAITPPPVSISSDEAVEPATQPEIAREAASPTFALREALSKDTTDLLAALERDPQAPTVGETLTVLTRQVESAMRQGKVEAAIQVVYNVVRVERGVEDAAVRRQYGIALRRMITRTMLDSLSKLVLVPHLEDAAAMVLQRAGPDGMEVLLELLSTSNTVTERRGVFNALIQMKEGQDQLVHMLGHPQWFVVRNVADIVGELGLEAAVPALAKQLDHPDERVRKQVALALAKIGTRGAAEPLRRVLRDRSSEVRRQAALGVGGRKASALAMPLVVALEEEKDPEVVRELVLALGRIGSPDAVQALIKIAQPSGRLFGRKPSALRMTAVEALRVAGTPTAIGTLQ